MDANEKVNIFNIKPPFFTDIKLPFLVIILKGYPCQGHGTLFLYAPCPGIETGYISVIIY